MSNFKTIKKENGFSLFELVMVIAILGIIASLIMVALAESRNHSKNTTRAAQIKEFQKTFDLYFSDTGHYPRFGTSESATICLGDYDDNACWENGNSVNETSTIRNAITPHYMGQLPKIDTTLFGQDSGELYEGMIYTHQNYGKGYMIRYFMEGNDKSCVLDGAVGSNVGDDTLCSFVVSI